jgi:hypothetical protein
MTGALPRLTYLDVRNTFALLRLLPMSDQDKNIETLVPRHQITVPQRQHGPHRVRFTPADRAFLAALTHQLPRPTPPAYTAPATAAGALGQSCSGRAIYSLATTPRSRLKHPGPPSTVRSVRALGVSRT